MKTETKQRKEMFTCFLLRTALPCLLKKQTKKKVSHMPTIMGGMGILEPLHNGVENNSTL